MLKLIMLFLTIDSQGYYMYINLPIRNVSLFNVSSFRLTLFISSNFKIHRANAETYEILFLPRSHAVSHAVVTRDFDSTTTRLSLTKET